MINLCDLSDTSLSSHACAELTEDERDTVSFCVLASCGHSLLMPSEALCFIFKRRFTSFFAETVLELAAVGVVIQAGLGRPGVGRPGVGRPNLADLAGLVLADLVLADLVLADLAGLGRPGVGRPNLADLVLAGLGRPGVGRQY